MLTPIARTTGLPDDEIRATLHSAYSKPRTPARPDSVETFALHEKVQAWVQTTAWSGRTGQTDRAVLLACCERAWSANDNGVFRASSREIAEKARIGRNTATRALRRLCDQQLLTYCGQDQQSGANLYAFGKETQHAVREKISDIEPLLLTGGGSGSTTPKTDAAERGALGKTAMYLYTVMTQQTTTFPRRAKALAKLAKLSVHQVYRALRRLAGFQLVQKITGGFVAIRKTDAELDEEVAIPAGTSGKGQQRRLKHLWERATRAAGRIFVARQDELVWWDHWQRREQVRRQEMELEKEGYSVVEESPTPSNDNDETRITAWQCTTCGQVWSLPGLEPDGYCDFCEDMRTWKKVE